MPPLLPFLFSSFCLSAYVFFADASDVFDSDSTSSNFFSELFSDDTQTNEYLITDTAADLDICLDAGTVEVLPSDDEDGIRVVETMSSSDSEENGLTYSVKKRYVVS
jgi:hypothetical protein